MASYECGKEETKIWIKHNFEHGSTALDVGACDGKWGKMLGSYLEMDGCEAFLPNITNHHLANIYRKVFGCDITDLEYEWYDLIIFGDVIEHMSVEKAQKVIEYAKPRCKDMVIAVPYLYSQGAIYGNPYEVHIQNDLTPKIFDERYKGFEPIWQNNEYAYYHRKL